MALENAAEGVVRETFGAAIALWQANHARDSEVRRAMQQIAEDECRHAELSWRVARWLHRRLAPAERERLSLAIRDTVATLRTEVSRAPHQELRDVAGLPSAKQAQVLLALLEGSVWRLEARRRSIASTRDASSP
jgi:hypothetical protein